MRDRFDDERLLDVGLATVSVHDLYGQAGATTDTRADADLALGTLVSRCGRGPTVQHRLAWLLRWTDGLAPSPRIEGIDW